VAGTIVEWTQQEEAKYQAALLAAEVEKIHHLKTKTDDGSQKKKGPDAPRSPKSNVNYACVYGISVTACCRSLVCLSEDRAYYAVALSVCLSVFLHVIKFHCTESDQTSYIFIDQQ